MSELPNRARWLLVAAPALLLPALGVGPGAAQTESEAAARDSLRAAETAFAASVAARDREAFAAFLDPEAVFVGGEVLRGPAAILEAWAAFFAVDGPRLEWEPEVVEVLESGGLGLTRGPYTLTRSGADGQPVSATGVFSSVWRRQPDGSWRVLFDSGCPPG